VGRQQPQHPGTDRAHHDRNPRKDGQRPDLANQWHINKQQRRSSCRALAEILNDRHLLKPGLDVQEASELAFLIVRVEGYFLATATLAWTPDRWEQTVVSLLITTLTAAPPRRLGRDPRQIGPLRFTP
jgi:hypothetical protein